jgi:hypothetical protein
MRNARSISACDWYSALCSLVKLSRIARFGSRRQGHLIMRLRPVQQPGDHAVLAFIDRARRAFAAHHAVNRLHRQLPGMCRRVGLPRADLAFA